MKCKVCGRELKGKGNICTNCYNEKQKQKELSKDKNLKYEIKPTFSPGYELLRQVDAMVIGIVLLLSIIISGQILYILLVVALEVAALTGWLYYRKNKLENTSCKFYDKKVVLKVRDNEKVLEYKDLRDVGYYQTWKQKLHKLGDIRIMPANSFTIFNGINIPDVKYVLDEFEKVKEIIEERVNLES